MIVPKSIHQGVLEEFARFLLPRVEEYFKDETHQKEYNEWLKNRKNKK